MTRIVALIALSVGVAAANPYEPRTVSMEDAAGPTTHFVQPRLMAVPCVVDGQEAIELPRGVRPGARVVLGDEVTFVRAVDDDGIVLVGAAGPVAHRVVWSL